MTVATQTLAAMLEGFAGHLAETDSTTMMSVVLLEATDVLVVASDGRHSDPERFIEYVDTVFGETVAPKATAFFAEVKMRPKTIFDDGEPPEVIEADDPIAMPGWAAVVVDAETAAGNLWRLRRGDDGRVWTEPQDGSGIDAPELVAGLRTLIENPSEFDRRARRLLFDSIREPATILGLVAGWVDLT